MASDPSSPPSLPEWFIARLNDRVVPRSNEDVDSGIISALLHAIFRPDRGNWMTVSRGQDSSRTVQTYTPNPADPDMTLPPYGAKVTTRSVECPDFCVVRMASTSQEDVPNLAVLIEMFPPPFNLPDDTPAPVGIILNGPKGAWLEVHPTAEGKAPEYTLSEYHNITSPEFLGFLHARAEA